MKKHKCTKPSGAAHNKENFLLKTQPLLLKVLQQLSGDLKHLLTNTFAITDVLREKGKGKGEEFLIPV